MKDPDLPDLRTLPAPLMRQVLSATLEQLRTFLVVSDEGSISGAARALGRDPSTVHKQVKALDACFYPLKHEGLLRSPERGRIVLTPAGEMVRKLAQQVVSAVVLTTGEIERTQQVQPIKIALTTFQIPLLHLLDQQVAVALRRAGLRPSRTLIHERSARIQRILLEDLSVAFSLGGIAAEAGQPPPIDQAIDFIELERESLGLLSNYPLGPLGHGPLSIAQLREERIPLILPRQGLIHDVMHRLAGASLEGFNVVEWCDDVHFGLDLLRLRIHEAAMICTDAVARRATAEGADLAHRELGGCPIQICVGMFRRQADLRLYERKHPVQIYWDVFKDMAVLHRAQARSPA